MRLGDDIVRTLLKNSGVKKKEQTFYSFTLSSSPIYYAPTVTSNGIKLIFLISSHFTVDSESYSIVKYWNDLGKYSKFRYS